MITINSRYVLVILTVLVMVRCSMDRYIFTLNAVTLDYPEDDGYPDQNLRIRICNADNPEEVLATTKPYPSTMTLPATFAIEPSLDFHLYKKPIAVQLWGDSTGVITTSVVNMNDYKIVFPLEMEMKSAKARFTLHGSWE